MIDRRLRGTLAAAFALLTIVVAHGASVAADALPVVRVVTVPIDAGSEVFYAQKLGFFQKNGISVEITPLNSGAAVAAAVVGGGADVGQSNGVSMAQAHQRGVPITMIAPANQFVASANQAGLIVLKDSPLQTARDFAGKTVAVSGVRGIMELGMTAWLNVNGGDAKSVKFVEYNLSQMSDAVAQHRIDAAVVTEPQYSLAMKTDRFRDLADVYAAIAPQFLMGGWIATPTWAKEHPQQVAAFAKSITEAARWANSHHAESAQILAQATNSTSTAAVHRTQFAEQLNPADLQLLIDACAKFGFLTSPFPAAQLIWQ